MQKLGSDPVVMQNEERRQGRSWFPENGSKPVPDWTTCRAVKDDVMFIFCCVRSTDKTKALLPIYSLFNSLGQNVLTILLLLRSCCKKNLGCKSVEGEELDVKSNHHSTIETESLHACSCHCYSELG